MDKYTKQKFTRRTAYQVWHEQAKKHWKLNEDPCISALDLLNQATVDAGLGPRLREIRVIETGLNDSYESLTFLIPAILRTWGA